MVYVITFAFILMDLITGLVGALKNGVFKQSIMREGLYHKAGSVLVIILLQLVEYGEKFVELGIQLPIVNVGCGYICLMELGSIIENISIINPELTPEFIKNMFQNNK